MATTTEGDVQIEVSVDAAQALAALRETQSALAAVGDEGTKAGKEQEAAARSAARAQKQASAEAEAAAKRAAREAATAAKKSAAEQAAAAKSAAREQARAAREAEAAMKASQGRVSAGAGQLFAQVQDVGVQLAAGTSPLTVAIQQGPQIASAFGLMGVAASTLLSYVLPLAAGVGALGVAWHLATRDGKAFEEQMRRNASELAAATEAYAKAAEKSDDLGRSFRVATGQISETVAEVEAARAGVEKRWAEALDLGRKNVSNLELQTSELRRQRDEILKGSSGWREYDGRLRETTVQLARARDELAETETQMAAEADAVELSIGLRRRKEVQDRAAADAARGLADAEREAARAAAEARREAEAALQADIADAAARQERADAITEGVKELQAATEAAQRTTMDGEERVQAELADTLAAIRATTAATAERARTAGEAASIQAMGLAAEVAAEEAAAAQIDALRAAQAQKQADRHRQRLADIAREEDAQRRSALAVAETIGTGLGAVAQYASDAQQSRADAAARIEAQLLASEEHLTDAQREALEKRAEAERKAARKAFRLQQALRSVEALINTGAAVVSALANPPGPPYSIPQALAAGAMGAAQVAAINAQAPPFHTGGGPEDMRAKLHQDEVSVRLLRKELGGVLNPTGAATMGDEGVRRLNAGMSPGLAPTVVYQVYDRRIVGRVVADAIRQGGTLDGWIRKGQGPPYGVR